MGHPNTASAAFNPDLPESVAFDRAFARRAIQASVRPETADDAAFLERLFIAGSPYAHLMPAEILRHQAALQDSGHRRGFPSAMRRIVVAAGLPIGHIVIDWGSDGSTVCVDIALLPAHRGKGLGRHLLESWIEVADGHGRLARLTVSRDNPALRLYERLGFEPGPADDPDCPNATMQRRRTD